MKTQITTIQNRTARTAVTGTGILALALATNALIPHAEAATVTLNGRALPTSVAPIQRNGRTLVPMRDIFQALGARVVWDSQTQGIRAWQGATNVGLYIGKRTANVNGNDVMLDQAPIMYRGSTMVPLRFVSEAMGARVRWSEPRQIAAITTSGHQVAGARAISVPAGSVVIVNLRNELSSGTNRVGDPFTAMVSSETSGYSEVLSGSLVEGVVREVQPKSGSNPGVLDLDFRTIMLSDGTRHPLRASLISLDNKSVDTSRSGRITAKKGAGQSNSDRLKVVGIGAGAGFLVGKLLKKNSVLTAVLGAAGGYLYSTQTNKDKAREAVVPVGTDLGMRIDQNVTFRDVNGSYAWPSTPVRHQ